MNNNQINQININENKLGSDKQGKGMFYAILAVVMFVIMAVGATFAYFTATTYSGDSAVQTGSTSLKLRYISYEEAWNNVDLIPASDEIAEYAFELQDDTTMKVKEGTSNLTNYLCKDDDGNSVCSVYVFQIHNTANSKQTLQFNLETGNNEFANLGGMFYKISIADQSTYDTVYSDSNADEKNGKNDPKLAKDVSDMDYVDDEMDPANKKIMVKTNDSDSWPIAYLITEEAKAAGAYVNYYDPIFVNRKGVEKTLLKYNKNYSDLDQSISLVPAISIDIPKDPSEKVRLADNVDIMGGAIDTYALVLYVKEKNYDQSDCNDERGCDSSKRFEGKIHVDKGDGSSGVTGSIGVSSGEFSKLQSKQTEENIETP